MPNEAPVNKRPGNKALLAVGLVTVSVGGYYAYKTFIAGKPVPVEPFQKLGLSFRCYNRGQIAITPEFRLDLRKSGFLATWQEGPFQAIPEIGAKKTSETVYILSKQIPSDWVGGTIDVKLDARVPGLFETTVWKQDGAATVE